MSSVYMHAGAMFWRRKEPVDDCDGSRKVKNVAKVCAIATVVVTVTAFAFYLFRIAYLFRNDTAIGADVVSTEHYLGEVGSVASQMGLQGMALGFSLLLIVGIRQRQQSYLLLWITSALVLLSLETVVVAYSAIVRHHLMRVSSAWVTVEIGLYFAKLSVLITTITSSIILFKHIETDMLTEERQLLL